MKLTGERKFSVAREIVWEVLNDPVSMAKLLPGVDSFDVLDERNWVAHVKVQLGLGALNLKMNMEKVEEHKPDFAKLAIKGTGVGAIMNMQTAFQLADEQGATRMEWEAEVRIGGPVGAMGQRVLQPIVNQQVNAVLSALDRQVQERNGVRPEHAAATSRGRP